MSGGYCGSASITAPDISHCSMCSGSPTCYPDPAGLLYLSQSGLQPHKAMCTESKCKGKPLYLSCVAMQFIRCHLSLALLLFLVHLNSTNITMSLMCCLPSSFSQQTMAGCVNSRPLVNDEGSWSLSSISFQSGDDSDKARAVQPPSYLPCNRPPPLCSSVFGSCTPKVQG